MNNAQTSLPSDNMANGALVISDVRRQIDSIDRELAALIAKRCALSGAVTSAKQAAGDHAFGWRPAREIDILRHVVAHEASLNPELAFVVWRALISANLVAQGDLRIVALSETLSAAKSAFSVGTEPFCADDSTNLLEAIAGDDHAIGFLPWPNKHGGKPADQDWWVTLMDPRFDGLYVCAASPMAGDQAEVLLIAKRPPEPAGDDISLVAGPIGAMAGGVLAQSGEFELVAWGEFINIDEILPTGCRLIGSFAVV